jgi:hypothetical protein
MHSSITTQNITENNCIISLAQNTNELQLKVYLAGTYRLLVTNKGLSAFPCTNKCQGQLQTPQSVSLHCRDYKSQINVT